jgi:hypothetical protein
MDFDRETLVNLKLMSLKYHKEIKNYKVRSKDKRVIVTMPDGIVKKWTWSHVIKNY